MDYDNLEFKMEDSIFIDDEAHEVLTPPEIIDQANGVTTNLLPAKSRHRYQRTLKEFKDWRERNGVESLSERTLLAYFATLEKSCMPTTLWAYYSMLKSTLNLTYQVDISKYCKLTAFLKRKSEGYCPKRAKVFTEAEMKNFIDTAPNNQWLVVKVACIFGLCGALRTDELLNIETTDVKSYTDMFLISIRQSKNKDCRAFSVTGNFFAIVKEYIELRPATATTNRFFLKYVNGKCTAQVIGRNKFSKMPAQIAGFLNLEEADKYTVHAFRRTSATVVANTGATIETSKRHGGWRSSSVAEQYIDESVTYKKNLSNVIEEAINPSAKRIKMSNASKSPCSMMIQESMSQAASRSRTTCNVLDEYIDESVTSKKNLSSGIQESRKPNVECSPGGIIIEATSQVASSSTSNPFHFHNCSVTVNYYQK